MELTNYTEHHGRGWSYPPKFNKDMGEVYLTQGVEDIERSLEIILKTRIGERIMNEEFGCGMVDYIFDSLDNTTLTFLEDMVRTSIIYHEARIDVEEVTFDLNGGAGLLDIHIQYKLRKENSRYNYVFPFYINEANN